MLKVNLNRNKPLYVTSSPCSGAVPSPQSGVRWRSGAREDVGRRCSLPTMPPQASSGLSREPERCVALLCPASLARGMQRPWLAHQGCWLFLCTSRHCSNRCHAQPSQEEACQHLEQAACVDALTAGFGRQCARRAANCPGTRSYLLLTECQGGSHQVPAIWKRPGRWRRMPSAGDAAPTSSTSAFRTLASAHAAKSIPITRYTQTSMQQHTPGANQQATAVHNRPPYGPIQKWLLPI